MRCRARTIVQLHCAVWASRPQLNRDPLGGPSSCYTKLRTSEYIATDRGRVARYRARSYRRLVIQVLGIEPRSKSSMPVPDQLGLQQKIVEALRSNRRQAFRGPVVLGLRVATTEIYTLSLHDALPI